MKNKIKELSTKHGLTQQQLANLVGIRRETIVFLEKGKSNPSLNLAPTTAQNFQLLIEEVFLLNQVEERASLDQ